MKISVQIIVVFLLLALLACNKKIEYPNEPVLAFNSLYFTSDTDKNTSIITKNIDVIIDFTDGDGNLGLPKGDASSPTNANLFYNTFYKKKGVWTRLVPIAPFPDPSTAWIPTLNSTDSPKPLKGKINATLTDAFSAKTKKDTMRLEIFVKDNAGNISNTITTSETFGLQ
jgi:hypothetical protein